MRTSFKAIIAASALAATSLAVVQPAQAHDDTGVAVAAGIIGLGVGAAIASDHHPRYEPAGYYGGYAQPYYYGTPYAYDYGYYGYGRPDYRRDHWRDDRRGDYGRGDYGRGDYGHRDHDDRWHR